MDVQALLDPEIATMLAQMPPLVFSPETLPAMRANRLALAGPVELSDVVERRDHTLPARDGTHQVTVRVHRPKNAKGSLPCVYWMHGGGYIMGTYEMDDLRFDKWCQAYNLIGVSVEYRLAPEVPYPGPLEDCYAGLVWTHQHADELGIDRARLGIGGASAGGGLAAGLALLARDRAEVPLAFQLLIYPMIDDRRVSRSSTWEVPIWNPSANQFGWSAYLGPLFDTDAIPPYAAAYRATALAGLPPALISVGTLDGFFDEDVEYAQRLNHAGVPVELHVYPGAPHGFDSLIASAAVSRRARRDMEEWLVARIA